MESLTYLLIFSITLECVHLTSAGLITNKLIERAELYYIRLPEYGEPSQIPLHQVQHFLYNNPVVCVHGYIANPKHDSISPVINGLLAAGEYDVIVADWSDAALLPYPQARAAVGPVGKHFHGKLAESFSKHNISFAHATCAGHSLGAHVCGSVGNATNGHLGQIIGLDPARPLISVDAPDCLRKTNAKKVCNLHTGSPLLGHLEPLGHIDFYSHFGQISQPGCIDLAMWTDFVTKGNACSHNRACQLFGESVGAKFNFPAVRCKFSAIKKKFVGECQMNEKRRSSPSALQSDMANRVVNENMIFFGMNTPESITGQFIFDTNDRAPFGMGVNSRVPQGYA